MSTGLGKSWRVGPSVFGNKILLGSSLLFVASTTRTCTNFCSSTDTNQLYLRLTDTRPDCHSFMKSIQIQENIQTFCESFSWKTVMFWHISNDTSAVTTTRLGPHAFSNGSGALVGQFFDGHAHSPEYSKVVKTFSATELWSNYGGQMTSCWYQKMRRALRSKHARRDLRDLPKFCVTIYK